MNKTIGALLIAFHNFHGPDPQDALTVDGKVSEYTSAQLQMLADVIGFPGQDVDELTAAIVLSAVGGALDQV